jgi:Lon protease-like protein
VSDEYNSCMRYSLLPLFPLQMVVFPQTELALHIFEDRYKEMIGECLKDQTEFGILGVEGQKVAQIGCTATVQEVVKHYEDGRMDILVRGWRRFEVQDLNREKAYLCAEVGFFDDEVEDVGSTDPRRKIVLRLLKEVLALMSYGEQENRAEPPEEAGEKISFQVIDRLPTDRKVRQALLEMRSESERLDHVLEYMEKSKVDLGQIVESRARAGTNGTVHR